MANIENYQELHPATFQRVFGYVKPTLSLEQGENGFAGRDDESVLFLTHYEFGKLGDKPKNVTALIDKHRLESHRA